MKRVWILGIIALVPSIARASGTVEKPIPNTPALHANDHFGDKVKVGLDLNGDGKPEMMVRNPFFDLVFPAVTDVGKITTYGFNPFGSIVLVKDFLPPSFAGYTPGFASEFDSVGDINGDGKPDLAAGWPTMSVFGFHGQVVILSGLNGSALRHKETVAVVDYGTAVVALGDIDADGLPDLAVSAPKFDPVALSGNYVDILSSVSPGILPDNLTLLRTFTPTSGELRFGQTFAAADTDGNGKRNLIVGSTGDILVSNSAGFSIFDPSVNQSSQIVVAVTGDPVAGFAQAIAAADIDGDGKAEIAVGSPNEMDPTSGLATGSLRVYNAQGSLLYVYYGAASGEKFASSVSIGPDFDADGRPDWVVGCPGINTIKILNSFPLAGTAPMYAYSSVNPDAFGASVACADFDVNGTKDILVGAPNANGANSQQGRASVVTATCDGTVANYGQGCAPIGGVIPVLNALGCPTAGGNLTIQVQNGIPSAMTTFVFGTQQASTPIGGNGCQLLVTPLSPFTISLSLDASGTLTLPFPIPQGLQGQDITMQMFEANPASGAGYNNSNGVHIKVGL